MTSQHSLSQRQLTHDRRQRSLAMRKSLAFTALAALLALAAALPASAATDTWTIHKEHSTVSIQVRHFLTKVRGQFDAFQGTVLMDAQHPATGLVEFAIAARRIERER